MPRNGCDDDNESLAPSNIKLSRSSAVFDSTGASLAVARGRNANDGVQGEVGRLSLRRTGDR